MFGDRDGIYRARLRDGLYVDREKLGGGINSPHVDGTPYIAPDESYLIFTSFRPGSRGLGDLYISFRGEEGWIPPVNMGPEINTPAKEGYPFVTYDGKYLFFMSNRISELNAGRIPDGPGNVYWVEATLIQRIRRKVLGRQ
jgi:Tol biopolymer transport system component